MIKDEIKYDYIASSHIKARICIVVKLLTYIKHKTKKTLIKTYPQLKNNNKEVENIHENKTRI